jgi:DNA repair exonuclease SbcCD nuclease subunit
MKILAISDIHLRDDEPKCRKQCPDTYYKNQLRKFDFILKTASDNGAIIVCGGDVFHKWCCAPALLSDVISLIKKYKNVPFYTIAGQHDLPFHRLDDIKLSSLYVLHASECLKLRCGGNEVLEKNVMFSYFSFGVDCEFPFTERKADVHIAVVHTYLWKNKCYNTASPDTQIEAYMKQKNRQMFDLIISGDNHSSFVYKYKNGVVLNSGAMMRMRIDEENRQPKMFLYDTNSLSYKTMPFPIITEVFTQDDKVIESGKEDSVFVESMDDYEGDFRNTVSKAIKQANLASEVRSIVMEALSC